MTKAEMSCMEELRNENAGLKYQLDMKRTEISELQDAVREKVRGIELATDRYVQVSCANTRLVEENVVLKKQITECNRAKLRVLEENTALRTALSVGYIASKPEAKQHDDTVDSTRYLAVLAKKKRAEEMIKTLKSQMFVYETMVEKLKGQNESFKKQLNDTIVTKTKTIDEDITIIENLKRKNATLQYKIDALEGDIVDLTNSYKKDLEEKKKENLDLDNNVKDMFATVRSLKKDKANLKDNLGFLSVKLQKRDEIIHDLKDANEELKAEIEVLLEKNYDLDNHVKNLVAQVETLDREKSELINELNSVVDNYDKSAISLKKEVLKKDDEIRSLKQAIVDLNDKKNKIIDKLNDEVREVNRLREANDRLFSLCKNKAIYGLCNTKVDDVKASDESSEEKILYPIDFIRTVNQDLLDIDKRFKDVIERLKKLEDGTPEYKNIVDALNSLDERIAWIEPRLEYVENKIDVAAMHPSMGVDLNLSEVKKDIDEKQAVIDALKDLDQRISWITDHMENYEAKAGNELLNAFNRICKLEEAQPKKSSKKTTKKTQKSELS